MDAFLIFMYSLQAGRIQESTIMLKALLRRWEEGDYSGFTVHLLQHDGFLIHEGFFSLALKYFKYIGRELNASFM